MQKIFLVGFLGRDPEERFTSGNKKVTSFPLAVSVYKGGENITIWYKIACWEETGAALLPHLKKGSCVIVTGDLLPPSTYQNKKGDIAIDMSVAANSIAFGPVPKSEKKEEEDPSVFSFGAI